MSSISSPKVNYRIKSRTNEDNPLKIESLTLSQGLSEIENEITHI